MVPSPTSHIDLSNNTASSHQLEESIAFKNSLNALVSYIFMDDHVIATRESLEVRKVGIAFVYYVPRHPYIVRKIYDVYFRLVHKSQSTGWAILFLDILTG